MTDRWTKLELEALLVILRRSLDPDFVAKVEAIKARRRATPDAEMFEDPEEAPQ